MLKPDPTDPSYKERMKEYEKDPAPWGPSMPLKPEVPVEAKGKK